MISEVRKLLLSYGPFVLFYLPRSLNKLIIKYKRYPKTIKIDGFDKINVCAPTPNYN